MMRRFLSGTRGTLASALALVLAAWIVGDACTHVQHELDSRSCAVCHIATAVAAEATTESLAPPPGRREPAGAPLALPPSLAAPSPTGRGPPHAPLVVDSRSMT